MSSWIHYDIDEPFFLPHINDESIQKEIVLTNSLQRNNRNSRMTLLSLRMVFLLKALDSKFILRFQNILFPP